MARIAATANALFIGAGELLYQFQLDNSSDIKKVNIQQLSDQLPKVPKLRENNENGVDDESVGNSTNCQCLCLAVSSCQQLVAVGTSSKTLLVFNTTDLTVRRSLRIPKAPTSITFDRTSEYIIVGDRAGHVSRYSMEPPSTVVSHKDITGEMSNFEGEPLVGAITMVLDVAVSPDNRYLIVAERDEKVRIHRYPKAYIIEALGLGHSHYVSSVLFHGDRLFSSGGDALLKEWDISNGRELTSVDLDLKGSAKKIIGSYQINKIVAIEDKMPNLTIIDIENGTKTTIVGTSELLDGCIIGSKCFGLARNGIILCDLESQNTHIEYFYKEESFVKYLADIEEPITSYFKNVSHDSMEDYRKRKVEKMQKGKNKKAKASQV